MGWSCTQFACYNLDVDDQVCLEQGKCEDPRYRVADISPYGQRNALGLDRHNREAAT